VGDAVATCKDVPRTTAEICEAIEEGSRGHWHEEVKLENGKVVVPPHIAAGHEKLRGAGLLCLTMDPAYGGYGLPALVNTAYLEMVARADASLMTIIGLQAGGAPAIAQGGNQRPNKHHLPPL